MRKVSWTQHETKRMMKKKGIHSKERINALSFYKGVWKEKEKRRRGPLKPKTTEERKNNNCTLLHIIKSE